MSRQHDINGADQLLDNNFTTGFKDWQLYDIAAARVSS
jgi:hypothetical protein